MKKSLENMFSFKSKPINKKNIHQNNTAFVNIHKAKEGWEENATNVIYLVFKEFEKILLDGYKTRVIYEQLSKIDNLDPQESIYGDSITIKFPKRAIPINPTFHKTKGSLETLSEDGAKLIFSFADCGNIFATIHPQKSKNHTPSQDSYLIKVWEDPYTINKKNIEKAFKLLLDIHLYGSPYSSNGHKIKWIMADIQAMDAYLTRGENKLIGYIKHFIKALRVAYGLASLSSS